MITILLLAMIGQNPESNFISGFAGRNVKPKVVQVPFSGQWEHTPITAISDPPKKKYTESVPAKTDTAKTTRPEAKNKEQFPELDEYGFPPYESIQVKTQDCQCNECGCKDCKCSDPSRWVWSNVGGVLGYYWGYVGVDGLFYQTTSTPKTQKPFTQPVAKTSTTQGGHWVIRKNCGPNGCTYTNEYVRD